jgi:hypothetical protein
VSKKQWQHSKDVIVKTNASYKSVVFNKWEENFESCSTLINFNLGIVCCLYNVHAILECPESTNVFLVEFLSQHKLCSLKFYTAVAFVKISEAMQWVCLCQSIFQRQFCPEIYRWLNPVWQYNM